MEELEWKQRSKERWLKEGDLNTKFFHKVANMRRRINHIGSLELDGVVVVDPVEIESGLVKHFTVAFQKDKEPAPTWYDEDLRKVPDNLWLDLEAPFSEREIQKAIFGAATDTSPGSDGFSLRFFEEFWPVVKEDLLDKFQGFQYGSHSIGCLNATFLALIPKKEGAIRVEEFRPISLVNGSYKMIAKVLANRLKSAIDSMIEANQTAFIPGRILHDGFMIVQECIIAAHKDKRKGVVIKLDFSKAYDNVRWDFLLHLLQCHGFEPNWIRMVKECITSAKACVLVNGKPCGFFHMNKGLRQGDPLSPLLFIVAVNAFSRLMSMAEREGWVKVLPICNRGPTTFHVQYADDTVVLCEAESLSIRGIKFVCTCSLSGLKINFQKSAMLGIHMEDRELQYYASIFGCQVQQFPTRLLGLPLHLGSLRKSDWNPLVTRFEKRLF
ncbi:hypothetical protein QJS04_geneDACA021886 [Acorus gramineus]|uniref:Reverse transcriptase domain-containing protein n=1 Tax=Acorus gramineus TaxID=55184 RepID=A0AAV9BE83_ACOGR|nr:hypothetical protein QJS04_geneDACA021886 [Acorus gramineus]